MRRVIANAAGAAPFEDRRTKPRTPGVPELQAHLNARGDVDGYTAEHGLRVKDISVTGVAVESWAGYGIGDKLDIRLQFGQLEIGPISACVVRRDKADGGCIYGCEFKETVPNPSDQEVALQTLVEMVEQYFVSGQSLSVDVFSHGDNVTADERGANVIKMTPQRICIEARSGRMPGERIVLRVKDRGNLIAEIASSVCDVKSSSPGRAFVDVDMTYVAWAQLKSYRGAVG